MFLWKHCAIFVCFQLPVKRLDTVQSNLDTISEDVTMVVRTPDGYHNQVALVALWGVWDVGTYACRLFPGSFSCPGNEQFGLVPGVDRWCCVVVVGLCVFFCGCVFWLCCKQLAPFSCIVCMSGWNVASIRSKPFYLCHPRKESFHRDGHDVMVLQRERQTWPEAL